MLYRIITEDEHHLEMFELVKEHLNGATIIRGTGLWQGQFENSLIIETMNIYNDVVDRLAKAIKELNGQDTVIVQKIDCESYLI